MCDLIFRVRPKELPVGITKSADPLTNFERYQAWAKKWREEKNSNPKMSDLQGVLDQEISRDIQIHRIGARMS